MKLVEDHSSIRANARVLEESGNGNEVLRWYRRKSSPCEACTESRSSVKSVSSERAGP